MARMIMPKVLPKMAESRTGELATKKAVPAVTSRPTVIHWYTWRMKTDATLRLVALVVSRKLSIEETSEKRGLTF